MENLHKIMHCLIPVLVRVFLVHGGASPSPLRNPRDPWAKRLGTLRGPQGPAPLASPPSATWPWPDAAAGSVLPWPGQALVSRHIFEMMINEILIINYSFIIRVTVGIRLITQWCQYILKRWMEFHISIMNSKVQK
jgi:hypothetical protein